MKSLILTVLYLAKDTVHRWMTHASSPLARILVVYTLSLCALAALGSYAISTKLVRDRIMRQGGDLVWVTLQGAGNKTDKTPTQKELSELLDVDSYEIRTIGHATDENRSPVSVFTYDFRRAGQFMPMLAPGGGPTYLTKAGEGAVPAGPSAVNVGRSRYDIFVRHLPEDHLLLRLLRGRGVMVQPENLPPELDNSGMNMRQLILRVRHLESARDLEKVERFWKDYMRLDGWNGAVISATLLLKEMDNVLDKQVQCRVAFCLGISCIVGILLTALAGMEYRNNEYIYTLMKSFGIHPALLVGAFVAENMLLVAASFAAALATFMHFQTPIVVEILKLGDYTLTIEEIMPEIRLIATTLAACVLVSSVPIIAAANRAIGRVLK